MSWVDDLNLLFRTRIPLVVIPTYDEERVFTELAKLAEGPNWQRGDGIYRWDHSDQFEEIYAGDPPFTVTNTATIDTILGMIDEFEHNATFVLCDFHQAWQTRKSITRKLRNLAHKLQQHRNKNIILLMPPSIDLPTELKLDAYVFDCPKPDVRELDEILDACMGSTGALESLAPGLRERIAKAALGLSSLQAKRVFRKALVASGDLRLGETCLDMITEEKCRIIRESGALEFFPHVQLEDDVGGLDVLKSWLRERVCAYTEEAEQYGIERPRGMALVGIPGTGKSLCAKMTATLWRMPLLRLDMGAIFESLLGHTEQNLRDAIEIAELVSPSILWIDEIEKAFAGSTGDHGTATRVLGTFLTWMQERTKPVFVIATANNVEQLSPELLRRGRFDEVFFLDLPTEEERKQILEVHLRKRGYHQIGQVFDLDKLAHDSAGFVGAELEAVVRDAMYPAFLDGQRELETADLAASMKELVPLAKSHSEVVERLRRWVSDGLARNASSEEAGSRVHIANVDGGDLDGPFMDSLMN